MRTRYKVIMGIYGALLLLMGSTWTFLAVTDYSWKAPVFITCAGLGMFAWCTKMWRLRAECHRRRQEIQDLQGGCREVEHSGQAEQGADINESATQRLEANHKSLGRDRHHGDEATEWVSNRRLFEVSKPTMHRYYIEPRSEQRKAAEEAERMRLARQEAERRQVAEQEAEKRRLAEEAEKKRRSAEEAERWRLAEEAEKGRWAEARLAEEAEKRRLPEERLPVWLGIEGVSVNADVARQLGLVMKEGVYVVRVLANSPAAEARLLGGGTDASGKALPGGDLIVGIDGKRLSNIAELDRFANSRSVGATLSLTVRRDSPGHGDSLVQSSLIDQRTVQLKLALKPKGTATKSYLPSATTTSAQRAARIEVIKAGREAREEVINARAPKEIQRTEAPPSIIPEKEMLEFLLGLSDYEARCCGSANRMADGTVVKDTSHFHLDHIDPKSKGRVEPDHQPRAPLRQAQSPQVGPPCALGGLPAGDSRPRGSEGEEHRRARRPDLGLSAGPRLLCKSASRRGSSDGHEPQPTDYSPEAASKHDQTAGHTMTDGVGPALRPSVGCRDQPLVHRVNC